MIRGLLFFSAQAALLSTALLPSIIGADIRFVPEKSKQRLTDWAHVEVRGEIVPGDTEKLGKALSEATADAVEAYCPLVIIDCPGGSVPIALQMGKLLREHHANTLVGRDGTCSSSCVFVFAGGVIRDLFDNGRFGLHRPRFDYEQFSNLSEEHARAAYDTLRAACAEYMKHMGISEQVFSDMLKVPSQEIRFVGREYAERYNLLGTDAGWEEWVRARDITEYGEAKIRARDRYYDCLNHNNDISECKARLEKDLRQIEEQASKK